MIYLVGGAPRTGKSLLSHRLAAAQRMGWIGTDLLFELLRVANDPGVPMEWNAAPDAIRGTAEWFKPYLDRFLWGLRSQADSYLIEGVGFLPEHVVAYAREYEVRAVFLGCSIMTLERFNAYPGRSPGYGQLPEAIRRQIASDIPAWSAYVERECVKWDVPYVDLARDFPEGQRQASRVLGLEFDDR